MAFLGGMGGMGGAGLGDGLIRIGAVTQGLRSQVRGAVNEVRQELAVGARAVEAQGQAWNRAFGVIGTAAKVGVFATVTAFAGGLAAAISYESAFAGVIKTVDAAPAVLERLRKRFREMSTEIPVSANEFARLGETAGALGIAADSIEEFARVTALIGVTTNVSSDQAATSLGQLSNVLALTTTDYEKFASTLVDLGNKGASTEAQILEIASRAGAGGKLIGLSAQQVLAFSSAIANLGIETEAGGSSLQNFFLRTQKLVASKDGLKALADVAGVTAKEFKERFAKDATGALTLFLTGLGKLPAEAQLAKLELLKLNDIRITRTLLGLANNTKNLTDSLATAEKAWEENNALQVEAQKRFETTASKLALLKNRIVNLLIGLGDVILPGFADIVSWMSDKLPKAAAFLADVWSKTLGPAVGILASGVGRLVGALASVFDFGGERKGEFAGLKDTVKAIAETMARVAEATGRVAGFLGDIAANPVVNTFLKLLAAAVGIRLAFTGTVALVSLLNRKSLGLAQFFLGGRASKALGMGGAAGAAGAAAAGAETAAAGELSLAAKELMAAAAALKGSAAVGAGRGALGGVAGGISYLGSPGPSTALKGRLADAQRAAFLAQSTAAQQAMYASMSGVNSPYYKPDPALGKAAADAGKEITKATGTAMAGGMRGALAAGGGAALAGGRAILGSAAKLFWPLMIAGLGMELVKAPIGDFIASNTQFKRAGAQMKEDFIGGLVNLVKSWKIGSDLFVTVPELMLGGTTIRTEALKGFDLTDEQVAAIQEPGLAGETARQAITPEALAKLQRATGEWLHDWARRVLPELARNGIDTTAIQENMDTIRWTEGDATRLNAELAVLIQGGVSRLVGDTMTGVRTGVRDSVVNAINQLTGGQVGFFEVTSLPQAAYDELARLVVLQASGALDPKVFALSVAGVLGDWGGGRPEADFRSAEREQARIDAMTESRGGVTAGVASGKRAIAALQADYDAALGKLTPNEEAARQLGLKQLAAIRAGIKAAGKDETKQAAFLAEVNEALGLTGEAAMTWEDLINWKTELSQDTKDDVQRQIWKMTKEWSVAAAAQGAPGGAKEFWRMWGATIATADTAEEKEALRLKLNALIPGEADDIEVGKLEDWLKDITEAAFTGGLEATRAAGDQFWRQTLLPHGRDSWASDPTFAADLRLAGRKLLEQIFGPWSEPGAQSYVAGQLTRVLKGLGPYLPGSPVRKGPLKHPFLPNAGMAIVKQIADGMALSGGLGIGPLRLPAVEGGIGSGGGQTVLIDQMNLLSGAERESWAQQFEFLYPAGR